MADKSAIDSAIDAYLKRKGIKTPATSKIIRERPRPQTSPNKSIKKVANAQIKAAEAQEKLAEVSLERKQAARGELRALHEEDQEAGKRVKTVTSTRIILALFLAVAYDVADGLLSFFGISEIIELPINIAFQFLLMKMLGGYFNVVSWAELVPFVDIFPFYTISVYMSYRTYRDDHETNATKKNLIQRRRERVKARKEKIKIFLNKRTKKGTLITGAIIMIALLVIGGFTFSGDYGAKVLGDTIRWFITYFAEEQYWQTINQLGSTFKGMIDWVRGQFDRQVEIAVTGDVFQGKLDEYANQKLGLELEVDDQRVKSEDRQPLIKNEKGEIEYAFITGGISGRGLDPEICRAAGVECETDQIDLSCHTNRDEIGTMVPSVLDFKYIEGQYVGTSCNFNNLKVGDDKARTIFMEARFDFISAGSIIKQMVSVDKFDQLFKEDHEFRTGKARYSPGPVSTKMLDIFVKRKVLIATPDIPVRFGVEFENTGEGLIDHFKRITIMVPDGVEVRACNPPMKEKSDLDDGRKPIMLEYDDDRSYLKLSSNRNMESGKRMKITCDLILTEEALYITDEITLEFFQVLAEYEYKIKEGVRFEIQEFERIVPIENDEIAICEYTTCECVTRIGDEKTSTKLLAKGENCGETHKEIAAECKEKSEDACDSTKNQCQWINDRYGCRIKTFSLET